MLRSASDAIWPIEAGNVLDDDKDAGLDETRSFAPRAEAVGALGDAAVFWPEAWHALTPPRLLAVDTPLARALDTQNQAVIVIPCLNEAKVIAGVVARILEDDGLSDPIVCVADGGSTDGSREIVADIAARDPRVRLIDNPDRLQSAGLNLATRLLTEDRPWLVRVDAHAEYPKHYVSTLVAEARRTGATSVVVGMETRGFGGFQSAAAAAQNSVLGAGGSPHRNGAPAGWVDHGHHAIFRLSAFEAVGGYDESFSHNEDAELDLRLSQAGGRIWLTDKVTIVYHPRDNPKALWRQYFNYGKGRARTVLKHAQPLKLRQALPLGVAPAVAALTFAPLFWPLAIPALVWAAVSLGYGLVLGARRREPAALLSGVAAMVMHLAWSSGFWTQVLVRRGGAAA